MAPTWSSWSENGSLSLSAEWFLNVLLNLCQTHVMGEPSDMPATAHFGSLLDFVLSFSRRQGLRGSGKVVNKLVPSLSELIRAQISLSIDYNGPSDTSLAPQNIHQAMNIVLIKSC